MDRKLAASDDPASELNVLGLSLEDLNFFQKVTDLLPAQGAITFEVIAEYLGLLDKNEKPDRFKPMRNLERVEKLVGTRTLIHRDKSGLRTLTTDGENLLLLAQGVLAEVTSYQNQLRGLTRSPLRVAASEAVMTYLFPHVLLKLLDVTEPSFSWLRAQQFHPTMLHPAGPIAMGAIDLAIAWDAYEAHHFPDKVEAQPLAHSRSRLHILFHPLHPFGHWVGNNPPSASPDRDERMLKELRKYLIVHPSRLPRLELLAGELAGGSDKCLPVDGFPDIVSHVRMRIGVGLFPGWQWLLKQIHRESYIQSVPIPSRGGAGPEEIALYWYRGQGTKLQNTVSNVSNFLNGVEKTLANLSGQLHDERAWQFDRWVPPFPEGKQAGKKWIAHFVTTGDRGRGFPVPHWRVGSCVFSGPETLPPVKKRAVDPVVPPLIYWGDFYMESKSRSNKPDQFKLEARLFADSLTMISHPTTSKFRTAFLSFSRRVTKKGIDGICLLGFIHFDYPEERRPPTAPVPPEEMDWHRPTVAPFLLCSEDIQLEPQDYRQIGDLLTFLAETDGIAHPRLPRG